LEKIRQSAAHVRNHRSCAVSTKQLTRGLRRRHKAAQLTQNVSWPASGLRNNETTGWRRPSHNQKEVSHDNTRLKILGRPCGRRSDGPGLPHRLRPGQCREEAGVPIRPAGWRRADFGRRQRVHRCPSARRRPQQEPCDQCREATRATPVPEIPRDRHGVPSRWRPVPVSRSGDEGISRSPEYNGAGVGSHGYPLQRGAHQEQGAGKGDPRAVEDRRLNQSGHRCFA